LNFLQSNLAPKKITLTPIADAIIVPASDVKFVAASVIAVITGLVSMKIPPIYIFLKNESDALAKSRRKIITKKSDNTMMNISSKIANAFSLIKFS
jgi:hypothetical protein